MNDYHDCRLQMTNDQSMYVLLANLEKELTEKMDSQVEIQMET